MGRFSVPRSLAGEGVHDETILVAGSWSLLGRTPQCSARACSGRMAPSPRKLVARVTPPSAATRFVLGIPYDDGGCEFALSAEPHGVG